ncbi:MAG: biotin synthase BioB [Methanopyri archaeon]|nr:biotin synthase BioB [Methanopyri archaeon]
MRFKRALREVRKDGPRASLEALETLLRAKPPRVHDLFKAAFEEKLAHRGPKVKLTSTIHVTNVCRIEPKCAYCGFAAGTSPEGYYKPFERDYDEIAEAAVAIEEAGIPRVSCSGAYRGDGGKLAVVAARAVKENTNLELLINFGPDLSEGTIAELARLGVETVCCNLETVNRELFRRLKPGDSFEARLEVCELVCRYGIDLSSGLLVGIGESPRDRAEHLRFLSRFDTLAEIPVMGFNPYPGTPMEDHPRCPLLEQAKVMAVARLAYPDVMITAPTPTIGPEEVEVALMAGADNLATVIPDNHPHEVKGVGNPRTGNLERVVELVRSVGLEPELRTGGGEACATSCSKPRTRSTRHLN